MLTRHTSAAPEMYTITLYTINGAAQAWASGSLPGIIHLRLCEECASDDVYFKRGEESESTLANHSVGLWTTMKGMVWHSQQLKMKWKWMVKTLWCGFRFVPHELLCFMLQILGAVRDGFHPSPDLSMPRTAFILVWGGWGRLSQKYMKSSTRT